MRRAPRRNGGGEKSLRFQPSERIGLLRRTKARTRGGGGGAGGRGNLFAALCYDSPPPHAQVLPAAARQFLPPSVTAVSPQTGDRVIESHALASPPSPLMSRLPRSRVDTNADDVKMRNVCWTVLHKLYRAAAPRTACAEPSRAERRRRPSVMTAAHKKRVAPQRSCTCLLRC